MSIIQSFIGTNLTISGGGGALPDPGGWFSYVDNQNSGLRWKIYNAYHFDNVNVSGMTLVQDDTQGYPNLGDGPDNQSIMFTGYMQTPPTTDNFMFEMRSDDGSYFWIGQNAWAGNFNIGNALINNGGLHGPQTVESVPINLAGNSWYPIRILFGNLDGGTFLSFRFKAAGDSQWSNATFANNTGTAEGFN